MDINKIGLTKWPAMTVRGESVTPEQALEVIRRTDSFWKFASTNERDVDKAICDTLKYPIDTNFAFPENWDEYQEKMAKWFETMGILDINYIQNSWVGTSYIEGPGGWIKPDGSINKISGNIGKWPDSPEVLKEWQAVAEAFPFLNLEVFLFSGESCEYNIRPVFKITVQKGKAVASEVSEDDDALYPTNNTSGMVASLVAQLSGSRPSDGRFTREHQWSPHELHRMWGHLVKDL